MSFFSLIESRECTDGCQSTLHGDLITAAISKRSISDTDLCAYLNYACCCCEKVIDSMGRSALHLAASCGRIDLVRWLIINKHANINLKDRESGYTPFHRSLFYGRIDVAVELIKQGANIILQDFDSLTGLEHVTLDGRKPERNPEGEIYSWGVNFNNLLGPQSGKVTPELLDVFHKEYPAEIVQNVCIDKFHSVILSKSGKAYSCGHGLGGRLGHGSENTVVVPKLIIFPLNNSQENVICTKAAISKAHSLFLMSDGSVYSCGMNKHRVLGITPLSEQLLTPKLVKNLPKSIQGIAAGRYHSVAWFLNGLYTWGLNAGQLGHSLNNTKYIIIPKAVKSISANITQVACSYGAVAIGTVLGDIYVLHEYQCRKIISSQLDVRQLSITGGKLNPTVDLDVQGEPKLELKIVVLTTVGNLMLWQESDPHLCRCIFSIPRAIVARQVTINANEILFITQFGEAYRGIPKPRRNKTAFNDNSNKKNTKSALHKFLDREVCIYVKLTKIPKIHRACKITSDPKGEDYCVIQNFPYAFFNLNDSNESDIKTDMSLFLEHANETDIIHDIIFKVEEKEFMAHRFILCHRSNYMYKLLQDVNKDKKVIELKDIKAEVFEKVLSYMYTGTCEWLISEEDLEKSERRIKTDTMFMELLDEELGHLERVSGFKVYKSIKNKDTKKKSDINSNSLRLLKQTAKKLGCMELFSAIGDCDTKKTNMKLNQKLEFSRFDFSEFYDVKIKCADGTEFSAHKCMLAARIEYFNNRFAMRWMETCNEVSIPYSKNVVEALLEYVYSDTFESLKQTDWDYLLRVLVLADEYFVGKLKQSCEYQLIKHINLKNVVQLLGYSHHYNAYELKKCIMKFLVDNLCYMLEVRALDNVPDVLLKELSECYFNSKPKICCRVITPYFTAVTDEEVITISSKYPVDIDVIDTEKTTLKSHQKRKPKMHKTSISESGSKFRVISETETTHLDNIIQFAGSDEVFSSPHPNSILKRINAITLAKERLETEEDVHDFRNLSSIADHSGNLLGSSLDNFPELSSSTSSFNHSYSKSPHKTDSKLKIVRLSQKERKRLSSESKENLALPPESPKNPWRVLPEIASPSTSLNQRINFGDIVLDEKKQKENLVKIQSKLLHYTQMEDKAIDELEKFYNIEQVEDEVITVERVQIGNIASPFWVRQSQTQVRNFL